MIREGFRCRCLELKWLNGQDIILPYPGQSPIFRELQKRGQHIWMKKPFKMSHTFVIILTIILAAVALTWIIPAGEYARFENAERIKVIALSRFSYIARTPVNPLLIPQ